MKLIIQIPCFNEEATLPQTVADLPREVRGLRRRRVAGDRRRQQRPDRRGGQVARRRPRDLPRPQPWSRRRLHHRASTPRCAGRRRDRQHRRRQPVQRRVDPRSRRTGAGRDRADGGGGAADREHRRLLADEEGAPTRSARAVVRRFSGTDVRDAASGFRAYSRDAAMRVQVFGRYTYTMETIIQAGWNGVTVGSVPIAVNPKTARIAAREERAAVHHALGVDDRAQLRALQAVPVLLRHRPVPFIFGLLLLVALAAAVLRSRPTTPAACRACSPVSG